MCLRQKWYQISKMSVRSTERLPLCSCPRRALEINSSAISNWHILFYGIINACCKLGFQWVPSLGSVGVHKASPLQKVLTALLTSNIPSVFIVMGISADGTQWWLLVIYNHSLLFFLLFPLRKHFLTLASSCFIHSRQPARSLGKGGVWVQMGGAEHLRQVHSSGASDSTAWSQMRQPWVRWTGSQLPR